jgi:hypothetical protein
MTQSDTRKRAMLSALESSLGVVSTASKAVGISRQTHYDWLKTDETYRKSVEGIEDQTLDFAESHLHQLIEAGNVVATIFYLKTKGKRRGYVERIEADVQSKDLQAIAPIRWADE